MDVDGGLYRIKSVLGSGATAVVCLAEPRNRPQQLVALKVLQKDLVADFGALNRIRDEGKMLRGLKHPHILQVYETHDYAGRPVIEMEYVRGAALDVLLHSFPSGVSGGAALSIGTKIAVALDAAYYSRHGPNRDPMRIIHRDLKPGNVLLSTSGGVKVADFGMAKARFEGRESMTMSGVVGTREFMPPEVLTEGTYSSAVDVYSLGMTLFKVTTGKVLVVSRKKGGHEESVRKAMAYLVPEGLPDIVVTKLRDLLVQMLQFEPDRRPELCNVAGELQRLLMHPEVDPDLGAFTTAHVVPLVAARGQEDPHQHAGWQDIAFLETTLPTVAVALTVTEAEGAIRKEMGRPGWAGRIADLHRVLERAEAPVTRPFLEVLSRQTIPWWRVWEKPSSDAEIEAALILLASKPVDAAVEHARRLATHQNERIANAAAYVVKVAEHEDAPEDFSDEPDTDDSYVSQAAESYVDSYIDDDDTDA